MNRIASDPQILGGKPCILGTRISVEMVLEWMGSGASLEEIVRNYPNLSAEDVAAAIQFAVQSVNHEIVAAAEVIP